MKLTPRAVPVIGVEHEARFRSFVQAAFGLRRKQLIRVVRTITAMDAERAAQVIETCGLDPSARPEVLTPQDFAKLVRAIDA